MLDTVIWFVILRMRIQECRIHILIRTKLISPVLQKNEAVRIVRESAERELRAFQERERKRIDEERRSDLRRANEERERIQRRASEKQKFLSEISVSEMTKTTGFGWGEAFLNSIVGMP